MKLLQSPWITLLLAMLLYAGSTFFFWRTPDLPKVKKHASDPEAPGPVVVVDRGPSWEFSNPEVDQLVRELRHERAAIAARAKQLDDLAARLKVEQAELQSATQAVHQLQRDFDRSLIKVKDEESTNLKRLARVYATMEPDGATAILRELDESTVVKVLSFMKDDQIAMLMTSLARSGDVEAKRVAIISERLRLLQAAKNPQKSNP